MTTERPTLSEREIRALLRSEPGPEPTPEQLARLRQRLALAPSVDSEANVDHVPAIDAPQLRNRPERARRLPLAAAAVLLAVVAVLVPLLVGTDRADEIVVTEGMTSTTDPPAERDANAPAVVAFCRDRYGPFVEAVQLWEGVDNWILLSDRRMPDPDLVVFADLAVNAGSDLVSNELLQQVVEDLAPLRLVERAEVSSGEAYGWSRAESEARVAAVKDALAVLGDIVVAEGWEIHPGCS
ncbi:MAG: hypothetical protein AAF567_02240 [Actinomycetota bacterium]